MSINLDRLKTLFSEINAINDESFGAGNEPPSLHARG